MTKPLKITLIRSPIGATTRQKRTVKALGLTRVRETVEQSDNPAVRGMIETIRHLVEVEE